MVTELNCGHGRTLYVLGKTQAEIKIKSVYSFLIRQEQGW